MTRDAGWRLLTVGRLLERLLGLTATLEEFVAGGALQHETGVDVLLALFDSAITFRARHQRHEDLLALVDVLVLDDANPRSLAGVLRRLRTELRKLHAVAQGAEAPAAADAHSLLAALPAEGAGLTLESLRAAGDTRGTGEAREEATAQTLQALCRRLNATALGLADAVALRHFALAEREQPVSA
jgi:uncharacterized alpha-E superfamily protein